jgi:hypothetical protein
MKTIRRVLNGKIYLLAAMLFSGWVIGLMYYEVGAAIHILPVLALFVVATAQSRRKKIVDTL